MGGCHSYIYIYVYIYIWAILSTPERGYKGGFYKPPYTWVEGLNSKGGAIERLI